MKKTTTTTTKKRCTSKPVTCMTCFHAMLHRYGNDPVLAACHCKPQPWDVKFPYEIEVASAQRRCSSYIVSDEEKTVQLIQEA